MNLREFWAAEAAKLRDTSALLDKSLLGISTNDKVSNSLSLSQEYSALSVMKWLKVDISPYPRGLKVIALNRETSNRQGDLTRCIFWWERQYVETYFKTSDLSNDNDILNSSVAAFKNEISHILNRVQDYENKQMEFSNVLRMIKSAQVSNLNLQNIRTKLNKYFIVNLVDRPQTVDNFITVIKNVYNPQLENVSFFDKLLVLPLSERWFTSNEKLLERYKEVWRNQGFDELLNGGSGEVLSNIASNNSRFDDFKKELISLKAYVVQHNITNTVGKADLWLKNLTTERINQTKLIVSIHDNTWYQSPQKYAQFIAIENSAGPFKLPAVLSVLIHELTQGGGSPFLPFADAKDGRTDGHIVEEDAQKVWEMVCDNTLKIRDLSRYHIDYLYQSQRAYAAIGLAIILHHGK
jgi:hypothetical protein